MRFRPQYTPIALDVGSADIKAVQLWSHRGRFGLHAAACMPRQANVDVFAAAEGRRLWDMLARRGFVGRDCISCIPLAKTLTGVMELPARSSGAPLDAIARQELARTCRCDPVNLELAWWELPGGARATEGTHVLAVGCRHEDALSLLAALGDGATTARGVTCASLDTVPTALARSCKPLAAAQPDLTAIVDLGASAADLIILGSGVVMYECKLPDSGLARLRAAICAKLNVDSELAGFILQRIGCHETVRPVAPDAAKPDLQHALEAQPILHAYADALAQDTRLSMAYALRRFGCPVSKVIITGGAAAMPGLAPRLSARLGIAVVPWTLTLPTRDHSTALRLGPAFAAAVGMIAVDAFATILDPALANAHALSAAPSPTAEAAA